MCIVSVWHRLTVTSSQYDIPLCCETLISDLWHISEFWVPGLVHPVLLCPEKGCLEPESLQRQRDGYGAFRQPEFECGCCEMVVFEVMVPDRSSMFSVFIATLPRWLYLWLFINIKAAVPAEVVRASFLFLIDLKAIFINPINIRGIIRGSNSDARWYHQP